MADTNQKSFRVFPASWDTQKQKIKMIRKLVFIDEQNVPIDVEMDDQDHEICWFVLAEDDESGEAIGTGRLLPGGKIGRMAVLKSHRGRGIGSAILLALMQLAFDMGLEELYLNGQTHAREFYSTHGFVAEGQEFDEAGISHIKMRYSRQQHS